jgi:hypothetical protein
VHYGNESGWFSAPLALMMQVLKSETMDMEIITSCLVNGISNEKNKKNVHRVYRAK